MGSRKNGATPRFLKNRLPARFGVAPFQATETDCPLTATPTTPFTKSTHRRRRISAPGVGGTGTKNPSCPVDQSGLMSFVLKPKYSWPVWPVPRNQGDGFEPAEPSPISGVLTGNAPLNVNAASSVNPVISPQ